MIILIKILTLWWVNIYSRAPSPDDGLKRKILLMETNGISLKSSAQHKPTNTYMNQSIWFLDENKENHKVLPYFSIGSGRSYNKGTHQLNFENRPEIMGQSRSHHTFIHIKLFWNILVRNVNTLQNMTYKQSNTY